MDELVRLGVSWMWLGLESPQAGYAKLSGSDTKTLCRELQENGIKLLGSTIIGMEHHTPENIHQEIEYAISHGTDFHQFMLYTPVPGTPLYRQIESEGRLLDVVLAKQYLDEAFQRDFEANGPSLFRICRTTLEGWRRNRNHPDPRVRERFTRELGMLRHTWTGILWAMEWQLRSVQRHRQPEYPRPSHQHRTRMRRRAGKVMMLWAARMERLRKGVTYAPHDRSALELKPSSYWAARVSKRFRAQIPATVE